MTTYVKRTLHLKKLRFKFGRSKDFVAPNLDDLLRAVEAHAPKFADRHFPPLSALPLGVTCSYITNIKPRRNGDRKGVSFEVGVYTHGLETDQLSLGDGSEEPAVTTGRIVGEDGKEREILHRYWCVALGETLIVDYTRASGGYSKLTPLLDFLFRYRAGLDEDEKLPVSELLDVAAPTFQAAIEAGGGVDKVTIKMVTAMPEGVRMPLARQLGVLKDSLKGTRRLSVAWESNDERIDAGDAEKLMKEFEREDSPIENIAIKLKDGSDLTGSSRFHEKQEIEVQVTSEGRVAVNEIIDGLWNYLDKLRTPNSVWRMVDDDGFFVQAKPLGAKKRK